MMSYLWILLLGSLLASHAKAQDEGDVTVAPETEDTATEPMDLAVDGEADGEADDTAETEASETEGELDTATDPAPTSDNDPEADPEPTSEPEPVDDSDPAADPEPTSEPEPADDSDPAADPEPTSDPEPADDSDPAADSEPTSDPEPADDSDPAADPAPTATPEPADDSDPAADPEPTSEPEPAADPESADDPEPTAAPEQEEDAELPATPENDGVVESETSTAGVTAVTPAVTFTVGAEIEPSPTPQDDDDDVEELEKTTPAPEVADPTVAPSKPEEGVPQGKKFIPPIEEPIVKADVKINHNQAPKADASSEDPEASKPQGSTHLAAILSGIIVSAVGAVCGYFAYQKRNVCFKKGQEPDPEGGAARAAPPDAKSEPNEQNTLLESPSQQTSD
ncbi:cell surface glycoprotein 1 isoform X2 [Poecilia reticulata]|uniref:cell surface glycoprotein 1 isoform X2 n=1 Tax=Poecilia reticulata TaxID=8081 RepID=UPI0004A39681|nr:PREDICTED: cell surface glycoprotein 1-like isoform X2 [Poecilia reticulata]